jgi:hypothetical protein
MYRMVLRPTPTHTGNTQGYDEGYTGTGIASSEKSEAGRWSTYYSVRVGMVHLTLELTCGGLSYQTFQGGKTMTRL